jgi:hypothetical protein
MEGMFGRMRGLRHSGVTNNPASAAAASVPKIAGRHRDR